MGIVKSIFSQSEEPTWTNQQFYQSRPQYHQTNLQTSQTSLQFYQTTQHQQQLYQNSHQSSQPCSVLKDENVTDRSNSNNLIGNKKRLNNVNIIFINNSIVKQNPLLTKYTVNLNLMHETVCFVPLSCNTVDYKQIQDLFIRTNKWFYKVISIECILNPYLYGAYLLKKEQLIRRHGHVNEMLLFHGTKEINVLGICKNNFNWRLTGTSTGHKFGCGVSFSPISYYATHYSDKMANIKVMVIAKVLVSNTCKGNRFMVLPEMNCDTSQNEKGDVIVKYEDNEYYPAYKVTYSNYSA